MLNNGSTTDDRGWSLSDHLLGDDEGGPNPGAPAMPVPAAQLLKAQQARRKRQKESYGRLTRHITNKDIIEDLQRNHFQNGRDAFLAVRASGTVAVDLLQMRELDKEWDGISIVHDIGISENTVSLHLDIISPFSLQTLVRLPRLIRLTCTRIRLVPRVCFFFSPFVSAC